MNDLEMRQRTSEMGMQLESMISFADAQGEHLLAAKLAEAFDCFDRLYLRPTSGKG